MIRNKKFKKMMLVICGLSLLASFVSCGRNSHHSSQIQNPQFEMQPNDGTYTALLKPINPKAFGKKRSLKAHGKARITIKNDAIRVSVFSRLTPMGRHLQNIYVGSKCPTMADDTNGDMILDAVEGAKAYGGRLISLDGNLNNFELGSKYRPLANSKGWYKYFRKGSLSSLMDELRSPHADNFEAVVKLHPGQGLNLDGRVVVIHGVPKKTRLPSSVKSSFGLSETASLPIACGVIKRKVFNSTTTYRRHTRTYHPHHATTQEGTTSGGIIGGMNDGSGDETSSGTNGDSGHGTTGGVADGSSGDVTGSL